MILSPGELSDQATVPVFLLTATKLGAFGSGTGLSSSPNLLPLPVTTNTKSPATSGEQKAAAFTDTFISLAMSRRQTILPSFVSDFVAAQMTSAHGVM